MDFNDIEFDTERIHDQKESSPRGRFRVPVGAGGLYSDGRGTYRLEPGDPGSDKDQKGNDEK